MDSSDQLKQAKQAIIESQIVNGLTEDEVNKLVEIGISRSFTRGTSIIREDERSRDLFVICKGRVSIRLSLPNEQSKDEVIYTMREGQIFGEISLVDGSPRSASVMAEDDVVAFQFKFEALSALLEEIPRIGYVLMRNIASTIASRVRNTNMLWRNSLIW